MLKRKKSQEQQTVSKPKTELLRKTTIKELIAPSGIDASSLDHLEIISNVKKYARSFLITTLPRMCTFPELFRDMYMFGDINTSIFINPTFWQLYSSNVWVLINLRYRVGSSSEVKSLKKVFGWSFKNVWAPSYSISSFLSESIALNVFTILNLFCIIKLTHNKWYMYIFGSNAYTRLKLVFNE